MQHRPVHSHRWVRVRTLGIVLTSCALVAGAACGGGDDDDSSSRPSDATSTTSGPKSTTTRPAAPTTTRPAPPTVRLPSPDAAAAELIAAWQANDRRRARAIATERATDDLFAAPGAAVQARGCNGAGNGESQCFFRYGAEGIYVDLKQDAGGWYVVRAGLA